MSEDTDHDPDADTPRRRAQTPTDKLRELVDELAAEAKDVSQNECASAEAKAHRNGVTCGLHYARDQLQELIDE